MTVSLPQLAKDLLDVPNYVTVSTLNPDGGPQSSVLWATYVGDQLLLSTIVGRAKERNLKRDPRISVLILDSSSDFGRFVEVRGTATMTTEGGPELIQQLSLAYDGEPFTGDEGTDRVRVVIHVDPDRIVVRDA